MLPHGDEGSRDILVDPDLNAVAATIRETVITDEDGDAADNYFYITGPHDERIYYPEQDYSAVVKQAAVSEIRFSGKASDLASGGWALVTKRDGSQAAYPISAIAQEEEWFEVQLQGSVSPLSLLRGDFKHQLRPRDHQVNNQPAWSSSSSDAVSILELADPELADQLQLGQRMLCAGDDYAVSLQLKDIDTLGGGARLHLEPAFHLEPEAAGLTRHGCSLYGNVVAASHGETQPEKILGNGDASRTHQRFGLPADDISWVADAGFASGVRADLSLRVGERAWEQVEALADSGPEDHHYQVEVDEDGVLWACFGDGRNGRRLPTGADNVRVRYRTGYGEDGNLAPQGLTKIARPNPLVEGFAAPLAASGGADKESSESLRESAPATVLALQRAVSLDDFTHLAAHHSMVWQARAFEKMPDRPARPLIEVVVVAAGGATFSTGAETGELIRSYLAAHAAPGTPVTVVSYQPLRSPCPCRSWWIRPPTTRNRWSRRCASTWKPAWRSTNAASASPCSAAR